MVHDMKEEFGIVYDELAKLAQATWKSRKNQGEWQWVTPGKFRLALGGPGTLTYADRASAERDAEKIRSRHPKIDLTVVKTRLTDDEKVERFRSLAQSLEDAIWCDFNDFNYDEVSFLRPPLTCDELMKALAQAVGLIFRFLEIADDQYGGGNPGGLNYKDDEPRLEPLDLNEFNENDLRDRFVEQLQNCEYETEW